MKEVGTEAVHRLVATPAAENFPAWSPDGREIAFHRGRGAREQGIFIVSRVGGPERRISETGTVVVWTPDGKSLLIRDRTEAGLFGIRQVNLDNLEWRWITRPESGAGEWTFAVSPDGNTLAFIRHQRPGISDLYVTPMRGGEPRRLTDWNVNLSGPAWMPDGKELIYEADDRLWHISATVAEPGRGTQFSNVPMPIRHFSMSRPGAGRPARLAFHTPVEQISLRRVDLDSADIHGTFLSIEPFAPSTRRDAPGRFSPDGTKVAFTSTRGSPDYELWVAERDGTNARQLTSFRSNRVMLAQAWSPDGRSILFETAVEGNNDIYVIAAQGGTPGRLTSSPAIEGLPDWSSDGQWIYYLSIAPGMPPNIWRMPAHGGQAEQITKEGGSEPQLSPDGRYVYYLDQSPMKPSFGARLMRISALGGQPTVVHEGLSPFYWCVTQRGVYFLLLEGNVHAVHLLRFSDGQAARVGKLPFQVAYVQAPGRLTVSRDGRWALVNVVDRREGDLMLLEDFR
jgi:Tol biopolymer transport system component